MFTGSTERVAACNIFIVQNKDISNSGSMSPEQLLIRIKNGNKKIWIIENYCRVPNGHCLKGPRKVNFISSTLFDRWKLLSVYKQDMFYHTDKQPS